LDRRLAAPPRVHALVAADGRRRWLTDLHPEDLHRYERAVAHLVPAIERTLGPHVFANRTRSCGTLRPVGPARGAWEAALSSAAARRPGAAAVLADVRSCYASIGPAAVDRSLAWAGVERTDREPVVRFLEGLASEGLRGLPIGPVPSAILGNGVLAHADSAVRGVGARVFRWVDDVVILAADPISATRGFDAWIAALHLAGLEPNDAKTRRIREIGACERWAERISRSVGCPVP